MADEYGFPEAFMGASRLFSFDFATPVVASRPTLVRNAIPLVLPVRSIKGEAYMPPYEDMLRDPVTGSPRGRSKGLPERHHADSLSPGGGQSYFSESDPTTPNTPSTPWYDDAMLNAYQHVAPAKPVYRTSLSFLSERTTTTSDMHDMRFLESSEDSLPTSPVTTPRGAALQSSPLSSSGRPRRNLRRISSHSSSTGSSPYNELKFEDARRKRRPSPKQVRHAALLAVGQQQEAVSCDSASDSLEPANSYYLPVDSMDTSSATPSASPAVAASFFGSIRQERAGSHNVPPSPTAYYERQVPFNSHLLYALSTQPRQHAAPPAGAVASSAASAVAPCLPSYDYPVEDDIASSCSDLEYTPRYESLFAALEEYQALSARQANNNNPANGDLSLPFDGDAMLI